MEQTLVKLVIFAGIIVVSLALLRADKANTTYSIKQICTKVIINSVAVCISGTLMLLVSNIVVNKIGKALLVMLLIYNLVELLVMYIKPSRKSNKKVRYEKCPGF